MVRGCVIFFEPATFQKGSYFIVHHPQLSQSLCVFILFNVFLVFFGFFFGHATSFRVVSQSSPPATIRIVVFLNFEYSFYSFFSVFFCTCEGFFFCFWAKIHLVGNYGPVGNFGTVVFFDVFLTLFFRT